MVKVKYRACLAITGGIQGTSTYQLYDELGLHSLVKKRWGNKIVNTLLPEYLYSYLDFSFLENYLFRSSSASITRSVPARTKSFKIKFFPYCINEWSKLKVSIRNDKSVSIFKTSIISKKKETSLFCIYDPLDVKLFTCLRRQLVI